MDPEATGFLVHDRPRRGLTDTEVELHGDPERVAGIAAGLDGPARSGQRGCRRLGDRLVSGLSVGTVGGLLVGTVGCWSDGRRGWGLVRWCVGAVVPIDEGDTGDGERGDGGSRSDEGPAPGSGGVIGQHDDLRFGCGFPVGDPLLDLLPGSRRWSDSFGDHREVAVEVFVEATHGVSSLRIVASARRRCERTVGAGCSVILAISEARNPP